MGVTLPNNRSLSGFRMGQVKNALVVYSRTGDLRKFFGSRSVSSSQMQTAVLFEELLERRLIVSEATPDDRFLTGDGLAIALGKTRRSTFEAASRVLDELLTRAEEINRSAEFEHIDKIWLFGSMMRRESTVGDIDLAIEAIRNPDLSEGARREKLLEDIDKAPNGLNMVRQMFWARERNLFGERKHPLLAGAIMGTDDIEALGVPCQLIFDRSRGGRVDDPVLPRHPNSFGRSNSVQAPHQMPELPILVDVPRPMDARWLTAFDPWGEIHSDNILPEAALEVLRCNHFYGCHALTDDDDRDRRDWYPSALDDGGLDGSRKVLLKCHRRFDDTNKLSAALVLTRDIHAVSRGEIALSFSLSDYDRPRKMKPRADHTVVKLTDMAVALLMGDLLRQVERLKEQGIKGKLTVTFDVDALPQKVQGTASFWLFLRATELMRELLPEDTLGGCQLVLKDNPIRLVTIDELDADDFEHEPGLTYIGT